MSTICRLTVLGLCLIGAVNASIVINSPANGATVTAPVQLSVSISNQPSIVLVYDNSSLILAQPSTLTVQSALNLTVGLHTLTVEAIYPQDLYYTVTSTITVSDQASGSGGGSNATLAAHIAGDMAGSNEGHPHGVPSSYDFYSGPAMGVGNNIAPDTAIEWWAALYVDSNGNPATNTQVAVKNVQLWILSKSTKKWTAVLQPTSSFDGGYYSEDFTQDYGTRIQPLSTLPDGSTAIITYLGEVGHIYTPWPRVSVNNTDIAGIVALAEARLVLIDPSGVDDRSNSAFLFSVGADPYPDATSPGIENNPSIANGKMKFVRSNWRSFAMTTMTQAQLTSNPPPVDLAGILP